MSNTCWYWLILWKVFLKPRWLSSLSFQQIFYWKSLGSTYGDGAMLTFKYIMVWQNFPCLLKSSTQWWCHVGPFVGSPWSACWFDGRSLMCTLIFIFSGLFSTKTFKQHRVMVPCWPLCWASLAPAAQHESDNQGIVHLTPSFSTFSHRGCIIVFCIVHLTPNSSFFSHHGALNPKISESSETFQVSHKSVLGHPFPISLLLGFSPHKI